MRFVLFFVDNKSNLTDIQGGPKIFHGSKTVWSIDQSVKKYICLESQCYRLFIVWARSSIFVLLYHCGCFWVPKVVCRNMFLQYHMNQQNYPPLYENDTKVKQNRPMKTTLVLSSSDIYFGVTLFNSFGTHVLALRCRHNYFWKRAIYPRKK